MCIIAVSEASFSRGDIFAKQLSDWLGYRYVDDSVILERATAGVEDCQTMEAALKDPASLFKGINDHKRISVVLLQEAVAEEVQEGRVVCYGGAVNLLTLEAPHILRIRVEAPLKYRVAFAQKRLSLATPEVAQEYLQCWDRRRWHWSEHLSGICLHVPPAYDLRIDLGKTAVEQACNFIRYLIEQNPRFTAA